MTKPQIHIASCSFGKDSIATILLAKEHNEPLDRIVFAEVMFDNARGISGEIPEHIEWIYNTAIPRLEQITGIKVDVVRSKHDYMENFFTTRKNSKYPSRNGKLQGFPLGRGCFINSMCKKAPIRTYFSRLKDYEVTTYEGLAFDETERLKRMHRSRNRHISLLEKYRVTERAAYELVKENGLLSPIYETVNRGGCWFCPNQTYCQLNQIRQNHPELWGELKQLEQTENMINKNFKWGATLTHIEKKIDFMNRQTKLDFENPATG